MGLVKLALGNIHGVIVFALFMTVLGAVAIISIPVDILPAFKVPAVQVLTYFNGMPARSVERTLTDRIERWVNQAPGVANVESRSVSGVSVVKLYFREDTDPTAALTLTSSLAGGAQAYLPTNTLPPVVLPFDPTGTLPLGILTVSNPKMAEQEVKDLARVEVRNRLGAISGVVAPVVVGGKDRRIMIYLDPKKLESRNLSAVDVVAALDRGNAMVSPGTAYFGENQVSLDTNMMVRTVDELNDMPITFDAGRQILLRDVGAAVDDAVIQKSRVRVNGNQQVFVPIYRQSGSSSLAVADGVRAAVPQMEAELPEGSKLAFVIDQSEYVRKAIESLLHEGIIGAILVSLMILIFLGNWKMTLIASLSLPLAIMGAIIGLQTTGQTINVMTLGGLFLAIGPLVDNAIVVLENTHRHLEMGKTPHQAASDATTELTMPVIVATLALIIVLCPVALTPGVSGFLFKPLTMAVAFAMFASFILSWTFVPALCSRLLTGHGHGSHNPGGHSHPERGPGFFTRVYGVINGGINLVGRGYAGLLAVALRHRLVVLLGVGLLFVASLGLAKFIGQEFFPAVDAGQITIQVRGPSNMRLDATERRIIDVEAALLLDPEKPELGGIPGNELQMVVSELGLNNDWSAAYSANAGQQDSVIRLQLTPERTRSAQQYAVILRKKLAADPRFADLEFSFDTGGMVSAALNFGASSPIDIQVTGGTPEQKFEAAAKIKGLVADVPGAADVRVLQRNDSPYLVLEVNREKAQAVGLSAKDVVLQVVTAMNSSIALTRNFWIDPKSGNQYFIAVQYPDNPYFKIEDLQNVTATGTNQRHPVQLATLVSVRTTAQPVEFNHDGLKRVVDVQVNTENRDIGSVAADIGKRLKGLDLPKGMKAELRGEYARMRESFDSLAVGLALASVLVYLLMVPLMRSFVMPLIIMATVPLGLIGVLVILWATGSTLNVQSEMGVIFLVGIIVSQGVLLMDFANQLRKQGRTVHEAIVESAVIRFKPILMTFLATFLDLLPMAIGLGRGSEALTPLARAVVGGLVSSTVLTLFVVPILYTLLIRDKRHPRGHHNDDGRPGTHPNTDPVQG
ncbi:acriflavin resistance protein : Cation/multidrug efflux pump OS=Singulisphaera acidiphila (strain ATCC BAA-1392 / DSM 18658 / VKM B-2454 / MOB10) GN=Sinac_0101 PE=4 SV=1: ACR_tran [Gemmataceae bacterium]|nr:acriflavin resistance protein : Cation/multidrug efflux pump OS=Singulisphaera acidiphila (strain ATCC BAA-1392 / DSM 18658 / VKM B-2454 / MOB10) GN=Sinac_0101 PE=4 SV=1: ACR_tran [Gemmataceae bacterium]VTT98884.1 acriflavin resistance protein : Cation/multidrug efflux pump OS=Singulisphaera acidiphila (strain ATCC BAA-1392 / DSM 18658 / VKM B-2454 / MOB10) GN=Sinac_0101 PE=4 SV=1: ACR_tran [Gemmataceae bacterium]